MTADVKLKGQLWLVSYRIRTPTRIAIDVVTVIREHPGTFFGRTVRDERLAAHRGDVGDKLERVYSATWIPDRDKDDVWESFHFGEST